MQRKRTMALLFALAVTAISLDMPVQPAFSLPPAVPTMAPVHKPMADDLPARVPATRQHPGIL